MSEIVKYTVGKKGHGDYHDGDVVHCYKVIEFDGGEALLYSPKDSHGCGCLFLATHVKDDEYGECLDEVFTNSIDYPWLKNLTAKKLPKFVDTRAIKDAINLLKQNGYIVEKE